jgi:hypothetical protein
MTGMARRRTWYRRFGDMPGVEWATPPGIDRTKLPGHDFKPQDNEWHGDGVWWPMVDDPDGSTGSSPAGQYTRLEERTPRSVDAVLREMAEALELPGFPTDYAHIIEAATDALWKLRLVEPGALGELERLCLLVLDVVRCYPEIIAPDEHDLDDEYYRNGGQHYLGVVPTLQRLYLDQGYLREAELLLREAVQDFGQLRLQAPSALGDVNTRLRLLESEDA